MKRLSVNDAGNVGSGDRGGDRSEEDYGTYRLPASTIWDPFSTWTCTNARRMAASPRRLDLEMARTATNRRIVGQSSSSSLESAGRGRRGSSEEEERHLCPTIATGSFPNGQLHLSRRWEHEKRVGKEKKHLDPRHGHDRHCIRPPIPPHRSLIGVKRRKKRSLHTWSVHFGTLAP